MSNFAQFSGFSGGGGKSTKMQVFTQSGTWVCPAANTWVSVIAIGGGGSGGNDPPAYGTGSSFGTLAVAGGGYPGSDGGLATGTGYNGGGVGAPNSPGAAGIGFLGIGSGGSGTMLAGPSGTFATSGGGSGFVATYAGNVSTNQTITVGAGGYATQPTGGSNGAVIVYWLE